MYLRAETVLCTLTGVACVAALTTITDGIPSHFATAADATESVHGTGTWLNTDKCTPTSPPQGGNVACSGLSTWNGPPLTGTTAYTLTGAFTTSGDLVGTIDETFTGHAANGAQGTIRFTESITFTAAGEVLIVADAVGGTGDFCHATGRLVFTGTADPTGIGSGPYAGHIVTLKSSR